MKILIVRGGRSPTARCSCVPHEPSRQQSSARRPDRLRSNAPPAADTAASHMRGSSALPRRGTSYVLRAADSAIVRQIAPPPGEPASPLGAARLHEPRRRSVANPVVSSQGTRETKAIAADARFRAYRISADCSGRDPSCRHTRAGARANLGLTPPRSRGKRVPVRLRSTRVFVCGLPNSPADAAESRWVSAPMLVARRDSRAHTQGECCSPLREQHSRQYATTLLSVHRCGGRLATCPGNSGCG